MTARQGAIVTTIMKIGKKHGKKYSFPAQKKILELIGSYHGYEISERTLRRDLRDLEENRFIETLHRKMVVPGHGRIFTSNLYKLKRKVFMWLRSMEVLAKDLFSHFHRPIMADNKLTQKPASSQGPGASAQKEEEKVEKLPPEHFQLRIRNLIENLG